MGRGSGGGGGGGGGAPPPDAGGLARVDGNEVLVCPGVKPLIRSVP